MNTIQLLKIRKGVYKVYDNVNIVDGFFNSVRTSKNKIYIGTIRFNKKYDAVFTPSLLMRVFGGFDIKALNEKQQEALHLLLCEQ